MNKTELINAVSERTGLTKKDAESAVAAFISTVTDTLISGDKVQIVGFGTFEVREREERMGRDPRTNQEIKIAASKSPAFKIGKAFKEAINTK